MALLKKDDRNEKLKKEKEPQYYTSATNQPTYNYNVYYMKPLEKILYGLLAFCAGALVGYLFYGGLGKDEFGNATMLTHILNISISAIVGAVAVTLFIPLQTKSIAERKRNDLRHQFRDMLDALNTSLGAGKNVNDSFIGVHEDLKVQYDEGAFILKELELIIAGIYNNVAIEETLEDFGRRSGIDDIKSFANVFRISYRKGGNIKDIIRNTHEIISDKMEIADEIETIVAANKMDQNIMIAMPILLIGAIKMMSPEFAANFATPAGILSTTTSLVFFVAAYFVGKKILDIKI